MKWVHIWNRIFKNRLRGRSIVFYIFHIAKIAIRNENPKNSRSFFHVAPNYWEMIIML